MDRRDGRVPRRAVRLAVGPERARREAPGRDHAAAGGKRRERRGDEAVDVEERHRAVAHVAAVEAVGVGDRAARRQRGCAGGSARPWACSSCRSCAAAARRPRDRAPAAGRRRRRPRARAAPSSPPRARPARTPSASQAARAALASPRRKSIARGLQILEVGAELVGRVGLVERRGGRAGGDDAEERRDDLGAVREAHRDGVAGLDAGSGERTGAPRSGDGAQLAVGRALAARRARRARARRRPP